MDAEGEAEDVEAALSTFSNAGRDVAAVISVVMNASILPLEAELAFEITSGITRRPFFQRFVEGDRFCLSSRFVDREAVASLLQLMAGHSEQDGLTRAIAQYSEALNHWCLGAEVPTLAHLFMGIEAIKGPLWREHVRKSGVSKAALAEEWGFQPRRRMKIDDFLNTASRGILVFKGDSATLEKAKLVSDAFEHGFRNAGTLYKPARESLIQTAAYLRSAILDLAGMDAEMRDVLLEKFSKPRGHRGLEMYLRSTLVGASDHLAAEGEEYPFFKWAWDIESAECDEESGRYGFRPRTNVTASCGPDVRFEAHSLEVWDAGIFSPPTKEDSEG